MQGGGSDDERTRGPETAVTATGALAVWLEHGPRHLVGVREVGALRLKRPNHPQNIKEENDQYGSSRTGFHQIVSQHATSFCNLGEAFHNRTANGHPSFVSQGAISCGARSTKTLIVPEQMTNQSMKLIRWTAVGPKRA
ncbi:hypothetical protein NC653_020478 [Populus alba x Populus x berolinensis]|uniref:Uncharacterized protein n=1 Tax=Populus alba x Populus x berolinensis TaxID=444605 RepID=A0AAD6QCM9_9ROSI|nr:hypothetical protein NC653_020478 [Populus alba x Populus x berolinensis]